jgi:alkylated DNA repair dioxygenase AlkB
MIIETHIIDEISGDKTILIYIKSFFEKGEVEILKDNLDNIEDWFGGVAFGKPISRLQRWYSEDQRYFSDFWKYKYERWLSNPYEKWLLEFQNNFKMKLNRILEGLVMDILPIRFDSVLINKYRDGNDYIKRHKDDERIFGDNPTIISLSVGAIRDFKLQRIYYDVNKPCKMKLNKSEKKLNKTFKLESGDILIMAGSTQKYYSHEIVKDDKCKDVRYNLTFRY